jgi:hypothetical protein
MRDMSPPELFQEKSPNIAAESEQIVRDLFRCENGPGFKRSGASQDAAAAIFSYATGLREKIATIYAEKYPAGLTADEAAAEAGVSILSARPRCSELLTVGLLELTGERRQNRTSRLKAAVLRASPLLRSRGDDR